MLLEVEQVASFYGRTPILQNLSFRLERGECLCVIGRNGVGKTTLIRTLMGLTDSATGRISLADRDILPLPTYASSVAQFLHGRLGVRQGTGARSSSDLCMDAPASSSSAH